MTFKKYALMASCAVLSLIAAPSTTNAAGFYIQEQSVKGLGAAFSGSSTSIEDASTVYFNPAGMTKLKEIQGNLGVHLIAPEADLNDTGTTLPPGITASEDNNNFSVTPVPNAYAVIPLTDQIWAGFGTSAPFGLGSEYNTNFFGRFDSTKTELKTINFTTAMAYKATEWLSVGFGVDVQYADANLQSALFAGTEGLSRLEGDDWSLGYNAGLQVKPFDRAEIGIHYRSAIKHELQGNISAEGTGAADFSTTGSADLDLPDIATFGAAYDVTNKTRLMAQATWFGWNNFEDITAISDTGITLSSVPQNYRNSWAFAFGVEHDWNDDWTVRAGYQFDETPTTDEFRTTRTPDGDRNWFSAGATYKYTDNIDFDFAATYIDVGDETINVSRNGGLSNVSADTDGRVGILAIGFNYKF